MERRVDILGEERVERCMVIWDGGGMAGWLNEGMVGEMDG